jgi:phosphopantothenoylcysteine decarboxylase/phosphopantothenate--cysteine ligase
MNNLSDKHIVLGICGGIAAYKSADLVRRLREQGAQVQVVMTHSAQQFISPLTLQALSARPVRSSLWDTQAEAAMGHIELARWADMLLIAPATADFIARLAHGFADDLLTTLCLATPAKIALAPAMNQQMWRNSLTQRNIERLTAQQVAILGPAAGEQACGDVGPGRMLEAKDLADVVANLLQPAVLKGKKILITAGPTREAIDPVRYISNRSSGKMGFAMAQAAAAAGAEVTLIAGPVHLATPQGVQRINVLTAEEMQQQAMAHIQSQHIFIGCAAVADYRVAKISEKKIASKQAQMDLSLVPNPDIIATLAQQVPRPFIVGFAAQTEQLLTNARKKLQSKNLDMIIANDVSQRDIGFDSEANAVTVLWGEQQQALAKTSKQNLAYQLIQMIKQVYEEENA